MKLKGFFRWRTIRRALFYFSVAAAGLGVLVAAVLVIAIGRAQRDFHPVETPPSPEVAAAAAAIPKYRRPEAGTYLTFTEWYLVFNPQDYADFIRTKRPSAFAYFQSIGQIWGGFVQTAGAAHRAYPITFGDYLAPVVLGASGTLEFAVKGVYESTIGRLSEWTASGGRTAEDEYAAQVARDYGEFIPTLPFFEFPFGRALGRLWTGTPFFGPHFIRKCERKAFLSFEYGFKAVYSALIRIGSRSVYGVADTEIFLTATPAAARTFEHPALKKIHSLPDGTWIVSLPHYQGFTDTAPVLARQGVDFGEIAGNDEILVTLVAPTAWNYDLSGGRVLFAQSMLNGAAAKRVVVQVPVRELGVILREAETKHLRVEHLFDY